MVWGGRLDDDASSIEMGVGKSDGIDDTFAATIAGSKIDEEDLIDIVMDDLSEFLCEDCFFRVGQLAFEDAQLEVIAPVSHGSEYFTEPFWVADIVGNDVGIAHDLFGRKKNSTGLSMIMLIGDARKTIGFRAIWKFIVF
jgi:hypothetical protein